MISIVDYGLGNIRAFENIYRRLGIPVMPVQSVEQLSKASKIILPGVGAFDWAMQRLGESGMMDPLHDLVQRQKVPVLGVCVGMQIMAKSSEEGRLPGLGWIDATVKRFDESILNQHTQVPHMGWNDVDARNSCPLFSGVETPTYYFLHSYFLEPTSKTDVIGYSNYGIKFASAIACDNVYATQFHPEKSHQWGIQLLKNFAELC